MLFWMASSRKWLKLLIQKALAGWVSLEVYHQREPPNDFIQVLSAPTMPLLVRCVAVAAF